MEGLRAHGQGSDTKGGGAVTEREAIRAWKRHRDNSALEWLMERHRGLVITTARHYLSVASRYGWEFDDLMSEAWASFVLCASRFDLRKQNGFCAYVVVGMKRAIRKAITRDTYRGTTGHGRRMNTVAIRNAEQVSGNVFGWDGTWEKHHTWHAIDDGVLIRGSDGDMRGVQVACGVDMREAGICCTEGEIMDGASLTPRERAVIIYRYRNGESLEMTGGHFGVSRERARQIEDDALYKLRRKFKEGS